jgi:SAM-dependent methyltransferase
MACRPAYSLAMSRSPLVFEFRWRSQGAAHTDRFVAGAIAPEALPADLGDALAGIAPLQERTIRLVPGVSIPRAAGDTMVRIDSPTLTVPAVGGRVIRPRFGRFYPRFLLGLTRDPSPCRCIEAGPGSVVFDCTHPLAGCDVECTVTALPPDSAGALGQKGTRWETMLEGPGMQARRLGQPTDFFSDDPFSRQDEADDAVFYENPRMVDHIDSRATGIVEALHRSLLKPGWSVLDMMSSLRSHLPSEVRPRDVVGLGMNGNELEANPALTDRVVHDLNRDPALPFGDGRFDAVLCSLSVEYLTKPFDVFADAARVLKPGGLFVCTFSNRWFPGKAIRLWPELHEFERLGLVAEYFHESGMFDGVETFSERGWPRPGDPRDRYFGRLHLSDPVYGVWARRKGLSLGR